MDRERVDVINSKGCSRIFADISSPIAALKSLKSFQMMSPALSEPGARIASGPFAGLVICVTGLSKEARKQVMAATERLGGQYSSSLHPQCTHLVVQCFGGRKFEHALKHGVKNGLVLVTLSWFVDSVRGNVRLSESLYNVRNDGQRGLPLSELNQCVGFLGNEDPVSEDDMASKTFRKLFLQYSRKYHESDHILSSDCIYIDPNISSELKEKVVDATTREGASLLDNWFIGCRANYVVCEGPYIGRYIGQASSLVTPLWILKSSKKKCLQRLVHLSSDLARQVAMSLENVQATCGEESSCPVSLNSRKSFSHVESQDSLEERQKTIKLAKFGVKNRRCRRMQSCQTPIFPITPSTLLDSICWSISEPTSSVSIYMDSSKNEDASDHCTPAIYDARGDGSDAEASFRNFSCPLRESEKREVIFKNHFLTVLFPIDRFGEMGPCSRTFFSDGGFTCLQVLDHIYNFYQENMSGDEINVAIHSDSRHAHRLRSLYASEDWITKGRASFKRIDFLGSRKGFEALKRVGGENCGNVYQLLIRA